MEYDDWYKDEGRCHEAGDLIADIAERFAGTNRLERALLGGFVLRPKLADL